MSIIWNNGEFKPDTEAYFSVYDAAMMTGYVFEMTRSFAKKHFKLKEHLNRLYRSAKYFDIDIPYTIPALIEVCNAVSEKNDEFFQPDDEHRLIINASHGVLGIYQGMGNLKGGTNIMITDIPLRKTVKGMSSFFRTGLNAVISNQRAIPSRILDNRVKHHNRLPFLRANIEISKYEGMNNWALLMDDDGFITESVGANFAIIKDRKFITPKPHNILNGISREYVMKELCQYVQLEVIEADIMPYDVVNADEAMFFATPFCILPVVSLDGQKIGNGVPGVAYEELITQWGIKVKTNIRKQIEGWDEGTIIDDNFISPYVFKKKG